jgi:hypothetical protein
MQLPWNPNVTKCVLHGVGSGAIFAIWVVVVYLFRGEEAFQRIRINVGLLAAFYVLGGAFGGLVVGIAWPILRWRVGAYATSLFVAFLLSFALSVLLWGTPLDWDKRLWFVVAIMTTIFGLLYGGSLWKAASVR